MENSFKHGFLFVEGEEEQKTISLKKVAYNEICVVRTANLPRWFNESSMVCGLQSRRLYLFTKKRAVVINQKNTTIAANLPWILTKRVTG